MKKEIKNEEKKNKHSKLKSVLLYTGTFLALFGVSGAATYFLIPSGVTKGDATGGDDGTTTSSSLPDHGGDVNGTQSDTDKFLAQLTSDMSNEGLHGTLNGAFNLENKVVSKAATSSSEAVYTTGNNLISINGATFDLLMPSLDEMSLSLTAPIDYNGKTRELDLSYVDKNAYFSVSYPNNDGWDVKYTMDLSSRQGPLNDDGTYDTDSNGDLDSLARHIYDVIVDNGGSLPEIDTSSLTSSIDTSAIMSALGAMTSTYNSSTQIHTYSLSLPLGSITLPITMESDVNYNLTGVSLLDSSNTTGDSRVSLGNGMSFKIDFDCAFKDLTITAPTDASSYNKLVDSVGLFDEIYPLAKSAKFGISLDSTLSHVVSKAVVADASKNIAAKDAVNESASFSLSANADLSTSSNPLIDGSMTFATGDKKQCLSANYSDSTAYVSFNNSLKASMKATTFDALIGSISDSDLSALSSKTSSQIDGTLGLITNSSLVTAIKSGHYEPVLDMFTTFKAETNKITIGIDLSPLGLADGSITMVIDANTSASSLATITFSNIVFDSFTFNGVLSLTDYVAPATIDATKYQELTHLPSIYDQAYSLIQSKQAAVTVSGSMLTSGSTIGFDFSGDTEFDIGAKKGTGKITINDHKADYDQAYKVAIDVQGPENDSEATANNMLFTYNSGSANNTIKGKFTIKTLNEIIDLVSDLMGSDDPRFTKYLDSMNSTVATTVIGQIMSNNLNALIENDILVSSSFTSSKSSFVISKDLLGTSSDISFAINYADGKTISSIDVALSMEVSGVKKDIVLNLGLGSYDASKIQQLDASDSYMDFSEVATLLRYTANSALFGVTSTNTVSTYHLTAAASLNLGSLKLGDKVKIDLYVYLDGAHVKVYGSLTLPIVNLIDNNGASFANALFGGTRTTTIAYDSEKGDTANGGTVYLYRLDDLISDKKFYRAVSGDSFMSNIGNWLLKFMLGFEDSIVSSATGSSKTPQPTYAEDVLKSFTFDKDAVSCALTLDLAALAHDSALRDMTCTIKGDKTSKVLKSLSISTSIVEVITIGINLDATLLNIGSDGSYIECWETECASTYDSFLKKSGFSGASSSIDL